MSKDLEDTTLTTKVSPEEALIEMVYTEEYSSKLEAYDRERQVKAWKSRKK